MIRIIAIPGSLRKNSSSNLILKAISEMIPDTVSFEIFEGVGNLPHFNDPEVVPSEITNFRAKVRSANAVLICTPEYAFGVPGSLKNAVDWTVSSGDFFDKPVGLITASSQGEKGHAALMLVMAAISAKVINDATLLISFVRSKLDAEGKIKDPSLAGDLNRLVANLVRAAGN
jgi:chromate reductase, NAD(P)H dehydrogenase (quinone)